MTLCEVDGVDRTEEFKHLDKLLENGGTNLYGALPFRHLSAAFAYADETNTEIVLHWLKTLRKRGLRT